MNENITFSKQDNYLLVTISDTVITVQRAQEILSRIASECSSLKCRKVLLDEMTVEKREVPSHEILKLSKDMSKRGLDKIFMAFLCKPHLINRDSQLLSMFTFKNEYLIQHFADKEEALTWLNNQHHSE